jgi:serine/threonine protein kinase
VKTNAPLLSGSATPDSFLQKVEIEGKVYAEVPQWMSVNGTPCAVKRRWNFFEGGFVGDPPHAQEQLGPISLLNKLVLPQEFTRADLDTLQNFLKEHYGELRSQVRNAKAPQAVDFPLERGGRYQLRCLRSGELRLLWAAFRFDPDDNLRLFECQWNLLSGVLAESEIDAALSPFEKMCRFIQEHPARFTASLASATAPFDIPPDALSAIVKELTTQLTPPRNPRLISVGNYTIRWDNYDQHTPLLDLGTHPRAIFQRPGAPPAIAQIRTFLNLLSHRLVPPNDFFKHHATSICNDLVRAGMPIKAANAVNRYAVTHADRLFFQALNTKKPQTVRRGTDGLPYSLVFLPSGQAYAKRKPAPRADPHSQILRGATKIGKEAFPLFGGEKWMRLVAHPTPENSTKRRLEHEFRLLNRLSDCPNLVRPIELVLSENKRQEATCTLLETQCNLGAISHFLPYLSQEQRLSIATDLIRAVAALHKRRVVHRDLKPGNCFLHAPYSWRFSSDARLIASVGDFDLALEVTDPNAPLLISGTPGYMAPEKERHASPSNRRRGAWTAAQELPADIWGLGILLADLLTVPGRAGALSLPELVALAPTDFPPVTVKKGSQDIDAFVASMLAFDPLARPTAAQLEEKWAKLLQDRSSRFFRPTHTFPPPLPYPDEQIPSFHADADSGSLRTALERPEERKQE